MDIYHLHFSFIKTVCIFVVDHHRRCLALKPAVIWLAFKVNRCRIQAVKDAGIKVIYQALSVKEAEDAASAGADVIVMQGCDAGGHGKQNKSLSSIISLIPQARQCIPKNIPVVAAGGIVDGKGLAASLLLGGDGIAMGTRFIPTDQSLSDPQVKKCKLLSFLMK